MECRFKKSADENFILRLMFDPATTASALASDNLAISFYHVGFFLMTWVR